MTPTSLLDECRSIIPILRWQDANDDTVLSASAVVPDTTIHITVTETSIGFGAGYDVTVSSPWVVLASAASLSVRDALAAAKAQLRAEARAFDDSGQPTVAETLRAVVRYLPSAPREVETMGAAQ